jgi:hypothetical protein
MKKVLLLILILVLAIFTAYKLLSKKETRIEEKANEPLMINKNSDAFNMSFAGLMNHYYGLKDAFVEWDTTMINQHAKSLQQTTDSLPLSELKADSSVIITAENYVSSIHNELTGLLGENSIDGKRHSFNMLSSEIYDLVRVVKYDHEKLYHIKCPMAFSDSLEGYWLSNTNKIVNPYLGKKHPKFKDKMLGCGEVMDSLDFSKK